MFSELHEKALSATKWCQFTVASCTMANANNNLLSLSITCTLVTSMVLCILHTRMKMDDMTSPQK